MQALSLLLNPAPLLLPPSLSLSRQAGAVHTNQYSVTDHFRKQQVPAMPLALSCPLPPSPLALSRSLALSSPCL
jgi:hypothetical protein